VDRTRISTLWREWRGILLFLLLMCAFRSSFADIYNVPTGSMKPTVVEGDRVLTEKMAYDLRLPFTPLVLWHRADPKRGDIVVLYSPQDGMRLLKRVVAVPGDVVQMRDETVSIDGRPMPFSAPAPGEEAALPDASAYVFRQEDLAGHEHAVMFDPKRWALRDFGPVTVPAGEYFVMGDNRDDSKDSRYIGFIPRESIAGRVFAVGYSLDPTRHYLPRFARALQLLH
jgi:signal peptidase I